MDLAAHRHVELYRGADLQGFRETLRIMTWCNIPPQQIIWSTRNGLGHFGNRPQSAYGAAGRPIILPRYVAETIELVVCHRDPEKYARLYQLVWRMQHEEKPQFEKGGDELVLILEAMKQSVQRDLRKMQDGVRFRQMDDPVAGERFIAWYEPEHHIVERASRYFIDCFNSLDWTILTPMGSLRWNCKELRIGPPAILDEEEKALGIFWRPYEESVFNPSRTNEQVMRHLMPEAYHRQMLEKQGVRDLVRSAPLYVKDSVETEAEVSAGRKSDPDMAVMARQEPKTLAELNKIIAASQPFVQGSGSDG